MTQDYGHRRDVWYFGDYLDGFPGRNYNYLVYAATVALLLCIALFTETDLPYEYTEVYIPFFFNLLEVFFISDYIGKIANTWSRHNYRLDYFLKSIINPRSAIDFSMLMILVTNIFPNDSIIVIITYLGKVLISIYFSELREVILRVKFILFHDPVKTFFPFILLLIITYALATFMYLIERNTDYDHFGSIIRALWYSFVSVTTMGYGDAGALTPETPLGRIISSLFGLFGIVCIALLTANIIDLNTKYDELQEENR